MNKHTKEPWTPGFYNNADGYLIIRGAQTIANYGYAVDRDRAIAEHNALAGIPTEALEAGAVKVAIQAFLDVGAASF